MEINIVRYTSKDESYAYVDNGEEDAYKKSIEKVCQKLNFDASDVTWVIYDPKDPPPTLSQLLGITGMSYIFEPIEKYYMNIRAKKICISTATLYNTLTTNQSENLFKTDSDSNLNLVDKLIIEAITRLQTKTTKNDEIFKKKLKENYDKFFGVDFSQIIS